MKKICKVLIVEDDESIQQVLSDSFSLEGYHFTLAGTGAAMRTALASDPDIDIVVIGLVLPGGAGGLVLAGEAAARGLPGIIPSGQKTRLNPMEKNGHRQILK